jgi:penicillin-binding protein 2
LASGRGNGSGSRIPRFLPPDPRVSQPYLLTPKMALRVAIVGAVVLVAFGVLFLRLWSLQVLAATKYQQQAQNNQIRMVPFAAPRGPILDSRGRTLVTNTVSNAVEVWPADLPSGKKARNGEIWQLAKVLNWRPRRIEAILAAHRNDGPIATTPVTVKVGISPDQQAYIEERSDQFRGIKISPTYLRYYNSEGLLAQTLGYVGRITAPEWATLRHSRLGYLPDDQIGQGGIEQAYDEYLHGRPGEVQVTVDSTGRRIGQPVQTRAAQPGNAVRLTIDISLQREAEKALQFGIDLAHHTTDGTFANGGAIVAMDPNTGAILALASSPTYKPRVWVYRTANGLKPLLNDKVASQNNHPILNRAIDAAYPPGSTWKPVTALAAMEQGLVTPYQTLDCTGSYSPPNPFGGPAQVFHNWDLYVNQWMDMPTALEQSCDTYFYQLGYDFYSLPPNQGQPLQAWAKRFGFGSRTGIDIGPEATGLVPTIQWRKQTYTPKTDPKNWQIDSSWKPGDSIQLSIGQKDIAVTPIQLTRFYALLANGGKLVTPYLVQDVEAANSGGKGAPTVLQSLAPPAPKTAGVQPEYLQAVRQGLYLATHDPNGTSSSTFGAFPVPVAGKTGTAEKVVTIPGYPPQVLNQSLWCGWGPYDSWGPYKQPKIVVCAVIENGGHGGTAAAPAAAQVLAKFFGVKAPTTGKVSD